jgi:hypothetical protein
MSAKRSAPYWAMAAAVVVLGFAAGTASAARSTLSGTLPNGGCSDSHPIAVNGPTRIALTVASTSAEDNNVTGQIVAPNGRPVATGAYDTPGAGAYAVRVCSEYGPMDPPTLQYTALVATGPAGTPALSAQEIVASYF